MEKKVMLITGASGGLGSSIAEYFQSKNYKLVLHHNQNSPLIESSDDIMHYKADLTKEKEVEQMSQAISDRFGRLDVVINNAGISDSSISWKTSLDSWEKTIATNLTAPFLVCKHTIPLMRSGKWGRIINISSVVGQAGFIGTSAYTASKAGLIGLTKTLSKELSSSGITANNLALGYFNKGMIRDVPNDLRKEIEAEIPLKRLGEPKAICNSIAYLIEEASDYITGQTINVNGGLYT
jgi:NAD(P)-dependent dehydrogenase (short-subunit alcohol dehydrogenase family)